jgi:hypothetical protein
MRVTRKSHEPSVTVIKLSQGRICRKIQSITRSWLYFNKRMALPSKKDTMLKASANVIHLGNMDVVNVGSSPIKRPRTAVEYREKLDAIAIDVKISAACLFTS